MTKRDKELLLSDLHVKVILADWNGSKEMQQKYKHLYKSVKEIEINE